MPGLKPKTESQQNEDSVSKFTMPSQVLDKLDITLKIEATNPSKFRFKESNTDFDFSEIAKHERKKNSQPKKQHKQNLDQSKSHQKLEKVLREVADELSLDASFPSQFSNCYSLFLDQSDLQESFLSKNEDREFSKIKQEAYAKLKQHHIQSNHSLADMIETPVINPILLEAEDYSPVSNSRQSSQPNDLMRVYTSGNFPRDYSDPELMAEPIQIEFDIKRNQAHFQASKIVTSKSTNQQTQFTKKEKPQTLEKILDTKHCMLKLDEKLNLISENLKKSREELHQRVASITSKDHKHATLNTHFSGAISHSNLQQDSGLHQKAGPNFSSANTLLHGTDSNARSIALNPQKIISDWQQNLVSKHSSTQITNSSNNPPRTTVTITQEVRKSANTYGPSLTSQKSARNNQGQHMPVENHESNHRAKLSQNYGVQITSRPNRPNSNTAPEIAEYAQNFQGSQDLLKSWSQVNVVRSQANTLQTLENEESRSFRKTAFDKISNQHQMILDQRSRSKDGQHKGFQRDGRNTKETLIDSTNRKIRQILSMDRQNPTATFDGGMQSEKANIKAKFVRQGSLDIEPTLSRDKRLAVHQHQSSGNYTRSKSKEIADKLISKKNNQAQPKGLSEKIYNNLKIFNDNKSGFLKTEQKTENSQSPGSQPLLTTKRQTDSRVTLEQFFPSRNSHQKLYADGKAYASPSNHIQGQQKSQPILIEFNKPNYISKFKKPRTDVLHNFKKIGHQKDIRKPREQNIGSMHPHSMGVYDSSLQKQYAEKIGVSVNGKYWEGNFQPSFGRETQKNLQNKTLEKKMSTNHASAGYNASSFGYANNKSSTTLVQSKKSKNSPKHNPVYAKILAKGVKNFLKPSLSNPQLKQKQGSLNQLHQENSKPSHTASLLQFTKAGNLSAKNLDSWQHQDSKMSSLLIPKSGSMDHIRKNYQMTNLRTHQRTSSNNDAISKPTAQNFLNQPLIGGLREKIEEKLNEQLRPNHTQNVYIKKSQQVVQQKTSQNWLTSQKPSQTLIDKIPQGSVIKKPSIMYGLRTPKQATKSQQFLSYQQQHGFYGFGRSEGELSQCVNEIPAELSHL